jgi:isopenicillin N synthase-like dioxygenase
MATAVTGIPIIDLEPARMGGPEEVAKVAHEVYQAFKHVGFAYIKNHGVPLEVIDKAFGWVRRSSPTPLWECVGKGKIKINIDTIV